MSDATYLRILQQMEELYPNASGDVLRAAARCETMMTQPAAALGKPIGNVLDIRTHAATLRRVRT